MHGMRYIVQTQWPANIGKVGQEVLRIAADEATATLGLPRVTTIYLQPENETEVLDLLDALDSQIAENDGFWPAIGCEGCYWFVGQAATPEWSLAVRQHMMAAHHLSYKVVTLRQVMIEGGSHDNEKRAPA